MRNPTYYVWLKGKKFRSRGVEGERKRVSFGSRQELGEVKREKKKKKERIGSV